MPEFSIIVPIYNVEKYLKICVDSILNQSFQDFEVILVDDGSPDRCCKICDSYGAADVRIKVIHKANGGLSSARNTGLDIASGKYVIFIDSDDYWDDNTALENIHKNLLETKADLLVFPAKRYYEDKNKLTYTLNIKVDRNRIINNDVNQAISYMIKNNVYRAAAWNKVVKKSIIDSYHMRFMEGYLSEDMDWCGDLLLYCNQFDFYEIPFYVYRQQRKGSITSEKTEKIVKVAKHKQLKLAKLSWELKCPTGVNILFSHRNPQDFLSLFIHADYVVTNSFHGVAFSINFNRQFTFIPRSEFNGRIESLLKITGLTRRIINFSNDYDPSNYQIEYDGVNQILDSERNKAKDFIDKALADNGGKEQCNH